MILYLAAALAAEFPLVPSGATWAYLDGGVAPGDGWSSLDFDDSAWSVGPAPLGYGIWDAATLVSYGPDPLDKHVTTWFRVGFTASAVEDLTGLVLSLRADDGALVYLNGTEVLRRNLPAGPIADDTLALVDVVGVAASEPVRIPLDASALVEGDNVLAIEVHQKSPSSSDLALDAALDGYDGATAITRGPYLQQSSDDGVVVRWRTLGPSDSVVWFGASPGALDHQAEDTALALDHAVPLTGLGPSSTWTYAVGSALDGALAGDDLDHQFTTHPPLGGDTPLRIWVLGDSGTADANAARVRDAFDTWNAGQAPDVWLMLGDNAYGSGTDAEYQAAVFDLYPSFLRRVALWSTLGNHDGYSASALTQTGPYFDLFTFPTAGEVGGEPSGTEAYYSFDVANVHFVCLDSSGSDRTPSGAMLSWLEADLAATSADWVLAFWHHPPYTKGSHDSDVELPLVQMRENALPLLEEYGVDLTLTGHSHSYERSYLLDGHHGGSTTLAQGMLRDDSDGTRDDGFAYRKPGVSGHEGAVHVVAGSSGKTSGGSLDHPVMHVSLDELGSLVIDVDGPHLDAVFLRDDGAVADHFAIDKGVTAIVTLDGPRSGGLGAAMTWTALALHPDGTEVDGYAWDLGDGTVGVGASLTHTYATAGTYPVTLTVRDEAGQPVVRSFDVEVDDGIPDVDQVIVPTIIEGLAATLSAEVSDSGGGALTTTWTFDDGAVVVGTSAVHTWPDDGAYPVTIQVMDEDGEVGVAELVVTVLNADPVVTDVAVMAGDEDAPVTLLATATDLGDDVLTYAWGELGDGPALTTRLAGGTHVLTLVVQDEDGGRVTEEVVVEVGDLPPVLSEASIWPALDEGEVGVFAVEAEDPGGEPILASWSFGDGDTAEGAEVQHAWTRDGSYTIALTLTEVGGGPVATRGWTIAIRNVAPIFGGDLPEPTAVPGVPWTFAPDVVDPGDDPLTWTLTGPADARVVDGVVQWTPERDDVGVTEWFTLQVEDGDGGTATRSWAVVVRPAGCGCVSAPGGGGWVLTLALVAIRRRRARVQPSGWYTAT